MIITHINEGQKAVVTVDGTVLTINGVSIDIALHQTDAQTTIDVCLDNQLETTQVGLGAWYVANIIVPARQYEIVEGVTVERVIDMYNVECRLWALPIKTELPKTGNEVAK